MVNQPFSRTYVVDNATKFISVFFFSECGYVRTVTTHNIENDGQVSKRVTESNAFMAESPLYVPSNQSVAGSLIIDAGTLTRDKPAVVDLTFVNVLREVKSVGFIVYESSAQADNQTREPVSPVNPTSLQPGNSATFNLVFSFM